MQLQSLGNVGGRPLHNYWCYDSDYLIHWVRGELAKFQMSSDVST